MLKIMKIKYPLKTTYTKCHPDNSCGRWQAELQYAPKESLQARYHLMSNHSILFYGKTKAECKEWARKFIADKRHIKARKEWRSWERHYAKKENQDEALEKQRKMSRAFRQMGF